MAAYMARARGDGRSAAPAGGQGLESYFLAGRKMPGWLNGCSYAATCLNADVAPAYCGMTVITGAFICWWYFSRFGLALMIGGVLFAVLWRRLSIMTSPEFYELRFSGTPAVAIRTWVALRSAFVAVVAWTGAGLLGMHKVAAADAGLGSVDNVRRRRSRSSCSTFCCPGYVGVVISDFFQTLVIIGASLTLMWAVLADFGGPAGLHDALVRAFGEGVVSWHPPMHHELLGVLGVVAWTIGTAVGYGGDAAPMSGAMEGQRILSSRNGQRSREDVRLDAGDPVSDARPHYAAGPRCDRAMAGPARRQHQQRARLRHAARSLSAARTAGIGRERHPRVDHVDRQLQHELRRAGVPERRLQAIARPTGVGSPLFDGRPDRRCEHRRARHARRHHRARTSSTLPCSCSGSSPPN